MNLIGLDAAGVPIAIYDYFIARLSFVGAVRVENPTQSWFDYLDS